MKWWVLALAPMSYFGIRLLTAPSGAASADARAEGSCQPLAHARGSEPSSRPLTNPDQGAVRRDGNFEVFRIKTMRRKPQ
jgi:hypothetical protein